MEWMSVTRYGQLLTVTNNVENRQWESLHPDSLLEMRVNVFYVTADVPQAFFYYYYSIRAGRSISEDRLDSLNVSKNTRMLSEKGNTEIT